MALHGHAVIELTDEKTGKVKRYEEDNIVTNGLNKVLQYFPTDTTPPISKVFTYMTNSIDGSGAEERAASLLTGGILLFDSQLDEDVDNILPKAGVNTVGCGSTIAYSGTNTAAGSYNSQESGATENGYKHVWDFTTSQANGQIACVCLTTQAGGFTGAGTDLYDSLYTYSKNSAGTELVSATDEIWFHEGMFIYVPSENGSSEIANEVLYADYKDSYIITFSNYTSEIKNNGIFTQKSVSLSKYRLMLKDFSLTDTNIQSVGTKLIENITVEMPESLKTAIDSFTSVRRGIRVSSDEGYIYIVLAEKAVGSDYYLGKEDYFHIWKINVNDFTSEHIPVQNNVGETISMYYGMSTQYTSQSYQTLKDIYVTNKYIAVMGYDTKQAYLINIENSFDVYPVTYADGTPLTLNLEVRSGKEIAFFYPYVINEKIYFGSQNNLVIDTKSKVVKHRNLLSTRRKLASSAYDYFAEVIYAQNSNGIILIKRQNLYLQPAAYSWLTAQTLPEILVTINNLSTPVTKTSAQSMKITYTITEE